MAIMIDPRRNGRANVKKSENSQRALDALNRYLEGNFSEPMKWTVGLWQAQSTVITYSELMSIVTDEDVPQKIFNDWFGDYSRFISQKITPVWQEAMVAGAGDGFNSNDFYVNEWIRTRSANLVTSCLDEQRQAIRYIIAEGKANKWGSSETARYIRPMIGLTEQQAAANQRYYNTFKEQMRKNHPRMTDEAIERKAREAAGRYAAKQQRTRAETIARTEMAMAYNQGYDQYVRQAIRRGLLPPMKKVWATAKYGNVCGACEDLEGVEVGMDDQFKVTVGKNVHREISTLLPPLHPRCRCVIMYEESGERISDMEPNYEGIPKTWQNIESEEEINDLTKVNPTKDNQNCANCVIAYEMRQQGKAVYAGSNIKKLRREPELGWLNIDIKHVDSTEDAHSKISEYLIGLGEGSRVEITGLWSKRGLSDFWEGRSLQEDGHCFVGIYKDGKVQYIDVQHAVMYNENVFKRMLTNSIRFWLISGKTPSDLGATACTKER